MLAATIPAIVHHEILDDLLGYPRDKIEVIINWTFAKGGLDTRSIEKFVGHPIMTVIPYVPQAWSKAINLGVPMIIAENDTPLVTLLENLVWHYSTEPDRTSKPEEPSEMWLRVTKRVQKARSSDQTPGKK